MSGKTFAVIGMRGMGKTQIVKSLIRPVNKDSLLVYDPNKEYTEFYDKPLLKFSEFAGLVPKVSNAVIVVEEATIFLNNRGYQIDFVDAVVRARHTNNTIILVFHSLQDMPKYLFRLMNMLIILKTNDNFDYVNKTFQSERLNKAFLEVKESALLVNKESGKQYSMNKVIDLFALDETEL